MNILNVIAQKPSSTGSGIYLYETVKAFSKMGHNQLIVCASDKEDDLSILTKIPSVKVESVSFNTKQLPFNIFGMSDVMPYPSSKYIELVENKNKLNIWLNAFTEVITKAKEDFKPQIVISHHLYLLTALTRDICDNEKVIAVCHNTDLKQYLQIDLCRKYIKEKINKLDKILALSNQNKNDIINIYNVSEDKIKVIGTGYNNKIFFDTNIDTLSKKNKILYVGKISKNKGVLSLIKAFNLLNNKNLLLDLVGGAGDILEYEEIFNESKKSNLKINFLGAMSQEQLAKEYNNHEIFILPSLSEGLPMSPIEAMACGCKVIISDLPGIKEFNKSNAKNAIIEYLPLPHFTDINNISSTELGIFEKNIANSINKILNTNILYKTDLSNLSWDKIANEILES